jgi:hypothetical protein
MPTQEKTPEQVQKQISAAFDSVSLINKTVLETVNDKKKELVKRNVSHCELMLTKEWFETTLTTEQKTQIQAAISAGNAYTA